MMVTEEMFFDMGMAKSVFDLATKKSSLCELCSDPMPGGFLRSDHKFNVIVYKKTQHMGLLCKSSNARF